MKNVFGVDRSVFQLIPGKNLITSLEIAGLLRYPRTKLCGFRALG
jgi:hypothetical protein